MAQCFCGCGRAALLTRRSPNAIGRKVADELERLEFLRETLIHAGSGGSERLTALMDDGEWLYGNLQALVHKEQADPDFSSRKATEWLLLSRRTHTEVERNLLRARAQHVEGRSG